VVVKIVVDGTESELWK